VVALALGQSQSVDGFLREFHVSPRLGRVWEDAPAFSCVFLPTTDC
jgi:hypothetical protein